MDLRSVERVRKRKNEDEEFMFVILPALYFHLTWQKQRQQRHLSFVYGKEHVRELLGGHLKNCLAAFRMEPNIFMWLASYLREEGLILDSNGSFLYACAGAKPRAQWNVLLEKSLVEILHEHDTPYHRGQNGWSGESWSAMVDMFHRRNPHVRFDKSQVHDKEKELKRDYRMLKDALGQSGVGWNESEFMLDAEPHLWDNLAISFGPRILKFKKKPFPLYETLANLYHKHTAEGNFNFTSTADQKPHMDIETDSDDEDENRDADFEILEQPHVEHVQDNQVNQRQVGLEAGLERATQTQASVTNVEANQRNGAGPSTNKPRKRKSSPKMKPKSTGDALVGVIDRFVNIKEKEVNNEAAQQFTISKCIAALRTLEGFDPAEKPKAFVVFKSVDNREIFLSSIEDNDGSALAWLRGEMAKLP